MARKHQKANFHTPARRGNTKKQFPMPSEWRGNDLKEMIKESLANINLRGLYHSHSYAINTGVMEVLLVTFSCSIQVYIGYLKPNKSFYMKLAA